MTSPIFTSSLLLLHKFTKKQTWMVACEHDFRTVKTVHRLCLKSNIRSNAKECLNIKTCLNTPLHTVGNFTSTNLMSQTDATNPCAKRAFTNYAHKLWLTNLNKQCRYEGILRLRLFCSRQIHSPAARIRGRKEMPNDVTSFSERNSKTVADQRKRFLLTEQGMILRLASENGYLSWNRNTYIMTLVGLTALNCTDISNLTTVVAAAALLTAGFNLTIGTLGFLYNLSLVKKRSSLSNLMCRLAQLFTLIHFLLWYTVLVLSFPDYSTINDDLEKSEQELSQSEK